MRHVFLPVLIYLGVVLQSTLVPLLPEEMRLSVPSLVLLGLGTIAPPSLAIAGAGLLGLALDGLSTERLGVQMGLATGLAWLVQRLRTSGLLRGPVGIGLAAGLVAMTWRCLAGLHAASRGSGGNELTRLAFLSGQEGLTTALVMCATVLLIRGMWGHWPAHRDLRGSAAR